ncbi:hypothetical protein NQ318_020537 [Aromia moschata]|uniref:Uncharacterized protein n=1 Tax=Aromia moschata TaxID=1265417 RepID=A0AAV8Z358_9CUCU|nr:hypothetical protein NQ318_020537 [Aromia moschata]
MGGNRSAWTQEGLFAFKRLNLYAVLINKRGSANPTLRCDYEVWLLNYGTDAATTLVAIRVTHCERVRVILSQPELAGQASGSLSLTVTVV